MREDNLKSLIEDLQHVIENEGVHGVLRLVNRRAPHRFTGVYRLEEPTLRAVQLFDRENPALQVGSDAPMKETYCSITAAQAEPFFTADAGQDARLGEHSARESTLSYCGVPLLDESGTPVGTFCHFDVIPREIPVEEISVLEAVAPHILTALRSSGAFPPE
jgi:GAF domain-containing protein